MFNNRRDSRLVRAIVSLLFAVPYSVIANSLIHAPFISIFIASMVIFYLIFGNLKLIQNNNLRLIYAILSILELGFLIFMITVKLPFLSGVDWFNFNNYAIDALGSNRGIAEIYTKSLDLFVFFIALIYKLFGIFIDQIYFYIFATSLLLFRYVYKTIQLLTENEKIAVGAALVVMAWPVNLIFSVSILREIPIQLAVVISFYNFIKYLKERQLKNLIGSFLFSIIAALMHSGMIAVLIAYTYILLQGRLSKKRKIISITALILASTAIFVILLTPLGSSITSRISGITSINDLNNTYAFQLDATTNYISSTATSFSDFIATAPYRFFMFSLAPLPWQVKNFNTLISFLIDGILQLVLISLIYKTIRQLKSYDLFTRNVATTAIICIVLTYLIFAMGTNNYGTAMRHRSKILPIEIILVSTFYIDKKQKNNLSKKVAVRLNTMERKK